MTLLADPGRVLLAVLALVVFAALVSSCRRHPRFGVLVLLAPGVMSALYVGSHASLSLGQTSLHAEDVACIAGLIVVADRLLRDRALLSVPALLLLGLVVTTVGLALVGAAQFGLDAAFNEYRGVFYVLPPILFVSVSLQTRADVTWLVQVWALLAVLLSGIAVLHWIQYGLGNSQTLQVVDGVARTGRGLSASEALVIAQGALLLAFGGKSVAWSSRLRQVAATWLLIVVALLQHRTVWILTAVALLAGLLLDPDAARRRRARW